MSLPPGGRRGRWWTAGGAVLSGVLITLALTEPSWRMVAWIALVPLFVVVQDAPRGRTVAAAVIFVEILASGTVVPPLAPALERYFALGPLTAFSYALVALVGLGLVHGALLALLLALRPRTAGPSAVLWYGAAWVSWEAARTAILPYYPAANLGISQTPGDALLQIASVGGIESVTFVLVACNAGLAMAIGSLGRPPAIRRGLAAAVTGVTLAIVASTAGAMRLWSNGERSERGGPVIASVDISARGPRESTLDAYLSASEPLLASRPTLLVWPESALTTDIERDRDAWRRVSTFVDRAGVPLLAGGPGSALRGTTFARFNAAHLVRPGRGMQSYHKAGLVPFAERWPPLFGSPPDGFEPVDAGTATTTTFTVDDTEFGVLICFEITERDTARRLAQAGARFIVNLTNDVWFPDGARGLHARWAPVRAVETGRPVVRVANAGVSDIYDRFGQTVGGQGSPRGRPGRLLGSVPPAGHTFYVRAGHAFRTGCLIVTLAGFAALARLRNRRGSRSR